MVDSPCFSYGGGGVIPLYGVVYAPPLCGRSSCQIGCDSQAVENVSGEWRRIGDSLDFKKQNHSLAVYSTAQQARSREAVVENIRIF